MTLEFWQSPMLSPRSDAAFTWQYQSHNDYDLKKKVADKLNNDDTQRDSPH
jgi:hypothetical protein